MRTVTHNTIFLTGASIIQKTLSFVFFTFLARTFSSTEIGSYSFALASTTLFAIIVDGGLTPVLIRHVAQDPKSTGSMLRRVISLKLVLGLLAVLALGSYVALNKTAGSVAPLIAVAGCVMLLDSVNLSLYGVLRGTHDLLFESIGMVFAQVVSFVGVIGVVLFHLPIIFALGALSVGSLISFCVAYVGVQRFLQTHKEAVQTIPSLKTLLSEAFPFALAGVFARGYSYLDVLLIGSLTNLAAAGTYSIANKLTFAFQFVPLSLSAAIYPVFAKDKAGVVSDESKKVWLRSMRYLLGVVGIIIMTLIMLRAEILGFFGKDHASATSVLFILSLSLIFAFLSYPVGALLNARGLQKFQTVAMGATLAVNVVCNSILIPRFGASGAAVSALVGNMVLFGVGAYFIDRRIASLPWGSVSGAVYKIVGSVLWGSLGIFIAQKYVVISHDDAALIQITQIGILALWGIFWYLIACVVFGVFTQDELQKFKDRLRIGYESITRHS